MSSPEPSRLARLSMSLPAELFRQLDMMVEERGLPSRSQLIAELIRHALAEHEALTRPEDMLAPYEAITGTAVDMARFRFWLVYSCLWWGVCCLVMADIWRRSDQSGPERLVIGRRVSEVEIDLLLMLANDLPPAEGAMEWPSTQRAPENGVPTGAALADAVSLWIDRQIGASASGHTRFEAKVAINALGMAARDAALGPGFRSAQARRLADLGLDAPGLVTLLRRDPAGVTPAIHAHLRHLAAENCLTDQPRYAGLAIAQAAWAKNPG